MKITKSQQRALDHIRRHIEEKNGGELKEHPMIITEFKVEELGAHGRLTVVVTKDTPSLPWDGKGNLLRFISKEHWHLFVGTHGGIEAISYPKSYEQFKGRRAFGFTFPKGY